MSKRLLVVVLLVGIGLLLVAAVRYANQTGAALSAPPPDGDTSGITIRFAKNPLPIDPFSISDLENRPLRTSDWRGKVTLVNFWATWCGPCRQEIPALVELQQKYGEQLQIVGIADDLSADQVRQFASGYKINYRNAMITDDLRTRFRIRALPTSLLLDRDGRVVQRHVGLLNPTITELEVRALLDLPIQAKVETFEDIGQISLSNAVNATDIPGVDLSMLTAAQKRAALVRLNSDTCTCGCGFTLAECRMNDPSCTVSPPLAQAIVETVAAGPQ